MTHTAAHRPASTRLTVEILEPREVPAVNILVDYTFDLRSNGGAGFFEDHPDAKAVLSLVAAEMGQRLDTPLAAITPGGGNGWTPTLFDPRNGNSVSLGSLAIPANTLLVYVGGRAMPGPQAGQGGYGGYGWSGSQTWGATVQTRGAGGFSTWGGSIAFDTTENWFFGTTTGGLSASAIDFYSVATHELGHLLGLGTSPQWFADVRGGSFVGPNAESVYGGPVPLQSGGNHWAEGLTVGGAVASLDPVLNRGTRVNWSSLDEAALRDIGWAQGTQASPPVAPPTVPPPAPVPPILDATKPAVLVSGPNGRVQLYTRGADGNLASAGRTFSPFLGYSGPIRTAVADFNGDGVADYAFTAGAGIAARTRIIDGATGQKLVGATTVLGGSTSGAFVAAGDINRDGKAELVVSSDRGGVPLVEIYAVVGDRLVRTAAFYPFGTAVSSGVRVALGDLNKDGAADLIFGTGAGQAPLVAVYDGSSLAAGRVASLRPTFLAFPSIVTAGVNVAAGDLNGDGYDDLIVSQDAGGTSLVRVWSGATITANPGTPVSSLPTSPEFYANGTTDRSGIQVAARDINGDGRDELVTAAASGAGGWLRVLSVTGASVNAYAAVFPFGSAAVSAGLQAADTAGGPVEHFLPPGGPCLCCGPRANSPLCARVTGHA